MADKFINSDTAKTGQAEGTSGHPGLSQAQAEGYRATDSKPTTATVDHAKLSGQATDNGAQAADRIVRTRPPRTLDEVLEEHGVHTMFDESGEAKGFIIAPDGKAPLTYDRAPTTTLAQALELNPPQGEGLAGMSTRDMNHLQFRALEETYKPEPLTGTHIPFAGDSTHVAVIDPKNTEPFLVTDQGRAADLSSHAEPVHITAKNGSEVSLGYDASKMGADGRPLVISAEIRQADGNSFTLKRLAETGQWKDSRTGEFGEFQVQRALGTDPKNTAEIMIKDVANPSGDMFFAPHNSAPRLTGSMTTEALLKSFKADSGIAGHSGLAYMDSHPSGIDAMKLDLASFTNHSYGDFKRLTSMENESLFEKSEDIGRFLLKEHGGKLALGVAAVAGLAIAGKYFLGSHDKSSPAPEPSSLPELAPLQHGQLAPSKFINVTPVGTRLEELRKFDDPRSKKWLEKFPSKAQTEQEIKQ